MFLYKRVYALSQIAKIPILLFSLQFFLIKTGDGIMSYAAPIIIEDKVHSAFVLGLIMAVSSLVGLIFDFIAGRRFKNKRYQFFTTLTIVTSISFPLLMLLGKNILTFIVAMAVWGIYYEAVAFSEFNFIKYKISKEDYSKTWGLFSIIASFAYFFGPMISALLIEYYTDLPLYVSIAFYFGSTIFILLAGTIKEKRYRKLGIEEEVVEDPKISMLMEIATWKVLIKKLWPILLFTICLVFLDSFIWSAGILYSEELKSTSPMGNFFIPAYLAPSFIIGLFAHKISERVGKKRTAFTTAAIAGFILLALAFNLSVGMIILVVLIHSIFTSIAGPSLWATFEDYISRVGQYNNDLIGLEQACTSLSYIIGPILAGLLSDKIGFNIAFMFFGLLLSTVSIFCLLYVPRKVKMPQKELEQITTLFSI